jgi:hypothetical protein
MVFGGVGLRRGRRDPTDLRTGDVVDFWRVEAIEPDRLLRLRAEMLLPGDAWLEWTIEPDEPSATTTLVQRAVFKPRGLLGRAYWLSVAPFHRFIFGPLARRIAENAAAAPPYAATREAETGLRADETSGVREEPPR